MRTDGVTQSHAVDGVAAAAELRSDLVDLSGFSLDELDRLPPNALTSSLRRILTESARQPHSYDQYYASSI
jgi:FXSXX-COOH protein